MNETLEAMARALFKSWFVDFDPVRAKAEGRQPWGLDAEMAALFPSECEESELGEIPKGWEVEALSANVEILSGGTPRTSVAEYWGGSIPWVSVVDTIPGPFISRTQKTITELGVVNSAASVLPARTLVITARGTVGNLALMASPMAMNQSCYGLRGRGAVKPVFLYHFMHEQVARLKASAHGSVFDTITRTTFDSVQGVWPPAAILEAFESQLEPWFELVLEHQLESRTLAELRDTLLPKLLSGEVRVREAERAVEAVV